MEKHNCERLLEAKGYTVVRFWERELESDIDHCLELLKKKIQA
jgi:very-short-patch-repair endonuclease